MHKTLLTLAIGLLAITAQAEVVVVGHPSAAALNKDQITDVYTGKSQAATPLDQPEAAAVRADFYKKAAGKDLGQMKALWSRLTFTGKGQPPKEVADSAAVKKAVAADPKAIGYIEKSAVDGSVKVLASFE
jgi:ABC-type phosphate transport system substrate-binding protein